MLEGRSDQWVMGGKSFGVTGATEPSDGPSARPPGNALASAVYERSEEGPPPIAAI